MICEWEGKMKVYNEKYLKSKSAKQGIELAALDQIEIILKKYHYFGAHSGPFDNTALIANDCDYRGGVTI